MKESNNFKEFRLKVLISRNKDVFKYKWTCERVTINPDMHWQEGAQVWRDLDA